MHYHIDTIPVWDAAKLDGECLLCALRRRVELDEAQRCLGAAVMEPEVRIQMNQQGFCQAHHALLYSMEGRLPHALMLQSHSAETARAAGKHFSALVKAADDYAAAPLGKISRSGAAAKSRLLQEALALSTLSGSCLICQQMEEHMGRYLHTFFHLWKTDTEFRRRVEEGKGFCLPHTAELVTVAVEELSPKELAAFTHCLEQLEEKNLQRCQEDLDWFIKKFDYRYSSEPWKNSRDAVPRMVNKLRGWCVGDEPNPKE